MSNSKYPPPEFRELINSGDVYEDSATISRQFIDHVSNNYPLAPVMMDTVDWNRISNSVRLEATHATGEMIQHFISTTTVGQFSHMGLVISGNDPCYVMPIAFFVKENDVITALLPWVGWFIAAAKTDNGFKYDLDAFLEWKVGGGMWLSGILKT